MRDLVRRSRCGRFVERLQPSRLYFSSFHVGSHPLQLIIDSSGLHSFSKTLDSSRKLSAAGWQTETGLLSAQRWPRSGVYYRVHWGNACSTQMHGGVED